jgi:hypothetical protein
MITLCMSITLLSDIYTTPEQDVKLLSITIIYF